MSIAGTEQILQLARQVSARLRVEESQRDRTRRFPHEEMQELKKTRLLGLLVPESFGGLGTSYETAVEVMMILAEGDSNIAQMTQPHIAGVEVLKINPPSMVRDHILSQVGR